MSLFMGVDNGKAKEKNKILIVFPKRDNWGNMRVNSNYIIATCNVDVRINIRKDFLDDAGNS